MLIAAFSQPTENPNSSKLSSHVKESGLGLSEASLVFTTNYKRLSDYRTSLQEDAEILNKLRSGKRVQIPDSSRNRYEMAVQVRKGEKEILHQVLQLVKDSIAGQTQRMAAQPPKRKRVEKASAVANKKSGRS